MRQPVTLCLVLSQYPRDLKSSEIIVATCMWPRYDQLSELLLQQSIVQSKILHTRFQLTLGDPDIQSQSEHLPSHSNALDPRNNATRLGGGSPGHSGAWLCGFIGIVAAIAKAVVSAANAGMIL